MQKEFAGNGFFVQSMVLTLFCWYAGRYRGMMFDAQSRYRNNFLRLNILNKPMPPFIWHSEGIDAIASDCQVAKPRRARLGSVG